ncbi:MAG: LON peptidase substrate-binding domain-containing protein, partial [Candidatus Levyibacteriota bacterium]
MVCFVLQKNPRVNDPTTDDLYSVGTLSRIERMIRTNGEINAQVRGNARVKILSYEEHDSFLLA